MHRRNFLVCAICGVVASHAHSEDSAPSAQGCLLIGDVGTNLGLSARDFSGLSINDGLENSSGDLILDKALGKALAKVAKKFEVAPAFSFFRDERMPNAYASPDTNTSGTWGTVAFGRKMFQEQFQRYEDSGISIIAIIAHEFGHIQQFKRKISEKLRRGEPTVRRIELHADYLAGWYLGSLKKSNSKISLWASGDTFKRIGDYEFNNPQHHGTPEQRIAASEAGFHLGIEGNADIAAAVVAGMNYLKTAKLD